LTPAVSPKRVDARNVTCPVPIVRLAKTLRGLSPGERVTVLATDAAFEKDIVAFCRTSGHLLHRVWQDGSTYVAEVEKRHD
jgi:tRNA 2-thiouridine synthesizing protein A